MLDPHEKYIFDDMVTELRAADPKFVRRIEKLGRPRRRLRVTLAILLWSLVPFCVFLGGWTGLLLGGIAAGYGARLMIKRTGFADTTGSFSWWSSSRRSSLGG